MDRGAWRATVYKVAKTQTQLKQHAYYREKLENIVGQSLILPRAGVLVREKNTKRC